MGDFFVYKIVNNINSKVYIGSSKNIEERKKSHINLLGGNRHHSTYLQNFYNKYNPIISFEIIEKVEIEEELWNREQYWIYFYQSYKPKFGFNCSINPRGSKGYNPIGQYSLEGEYIQTFDNIKLASKYIREKYNLGIGRPHDYRNIAGFQWHQFDIEEEIPKKMSSIAIYYCSYNKEGHLVGVYNNLTEATLSVNENSTLKSNIKRSIDNSTQTYKGFYWRVFTIKAEIPFNIKIPNIIKYFKKVTIYNSKESIDFNSVTEASKFLKCNIQSVSRVLGNKENGGYNNTVKGYKVKYTD